LTGEDARGSPLYFHDAPLLRCFTESGLELLIPCYEIFRRFYGLTSELSNAMLAGHWKRELATLVDMERTRVSEDGKSFEVLPRVDLRDIGCMGVALFLTMATASSRAAEIFPAIENARRSGIREPWILAYPPWHKQTMSLNLVGHQMRSGAVLVQWIYSSPFPHLPYRVVRIDPNLRIPVANEDAAEQPGRASPEDRIEELEDATIQPARDARASRGAVHFGLGDYWDGLIRVKRKAGSSTYVPFNPQSEGAPPPRRRLRLTTAGPTSAVRRPRPLAAMPRTSS
jgi:PAS domain-containing protein